jgi:phage-related protein
MAWTVETVNESVDAELLSLPDDVQASFIRLVERIRAVGLANIREPHLRHLRGKLWEMRLRGRDGIGRAIYVTLAGQRIVVLHAFAKKSRRTPGTALALAERRFKEIRR